MGFSPAEVGEMSPWQFSACVEAWNAANGGEPALPPPTDEEHDYLVAKYG